MKRNEVAWRLWPERAWDEIASLLGVEKADTTTPGWLGKRLTALGNVRSRLTTSEKQELEVERDKLAAQGNSEEVKRRSVPMHEPMPTVHIILQAGRKELDTSVEQRFQEALA